MPTPQPPRDLKSTASDVATTLAGSLKTQPFIVGLLIVNVVFVAAMFIAIREARLQEHAEMRLLLERCIPNVIHGQTGGS